MKEESEQTSSSRHHMRYIQNLKNQSEVKTVKRKVENREEKKYSRNVGGNCGPELDLEVQKRYQQDFNRYQRQIEKTKNLFGQPKAA
ncbi:MAG TPA: hypothetical protein PKN86_08205 [Candidatus Obscuribacter sp.]|nr:hypothetical protein [Candidatus Obscuribacter sp.]HNM49670.1 hypothetical protein [Candidatus Obscuribacter sp.]